MRKLLLLLGLTAFCLCAFVAADEQPNRQADKSSLKEDGVLQLKKGNFNRALKKYKQLLVHFYAPLSGEGHRISAAFEGAAAELKGSEVKLAVVDVAKEKELAKELNVTGFATILLYISGDKLNPVLCPVPQSSASILTWLKRRSGSADDLIADLSQSEASEELTVVGFFKELNSEYVQMFYAAATDLPDINFAVTQNNDVISKYGLTHDVVLLFKKSKLIQAYKMMPETSKEMLIVFITVYQMEPATEYTGQTSTQILTSPVLNHALLFVNTSSADFKEIHSAFTSAAEAFRLKMLFVWVNVDEPRNGRLMEYFRVREFEAPLIRMVNLTDHVTYHLPSDTLDEQTIKTFCQSYLDGKAKPKMQSEPIPEGWDTQPVKELVGMTLEKVGFNPDNTVFVMFCTCVCVCVDAPWCGHCKSLDPIWVELGEKYADKDDLIIAKMDATANEVESLSIEGFPTLKYFPAGGKEVVNYSGNRDLETMSKFLDNGGVLPEEEGDDEEDEDDDEGEVVVDEEADDSAEVPTNNTSKDEL
ncbi:protein disulfide-isomerase [Notothenia coriiceps]|uniref:protein disulfide-isomerase n=1 Tax=Notothenia coriiceps TaxID=8208 RepID=A0A6I9NE84_9TELE|nr:PREDICTED: protein disulfide-isomerase-like [Notothenia coriiceps]